MSEPHVLAGCVVHYRYFAPRNVYKLEVAGAVFDVFVQRLQETTGLRFTDDPWPPRAGEDDEQVRALFTALATHVAMPIREGDAWLRPLLEAILHRLEEHGP